MKPGRLLAINAFSLVAPHAGAWIETIPLSSRWTSRAVAPHAGAWIETSRPNHGPGTDKSPPTRGRGLKQMTANR